jgi:GNAT superfamily N-acetyltransferase
VLHFTPSLLAPGDGKSAAFDPAPFTWTQIRSADHPLFVPAYDALWEEFGAVHELESREVLAARFALGPAMRYEMIAAADTSPGAPVFAAIRDHTAIWLEGEVIVHLSHVLVAPEWRRSGLAGWMRAAPIPTAREMAAAHGAPEAPVTLVGEMEYDDGTDPKCAIRLAAYERAGYVKADPAVVHYHQPDFRAPADIDASGGPRPLPFQLVIRQIGREHERTVTGARLRRFVRALYTMYAAQFRPQDMAHPLLRLDGHPAAEASVPLVPPSTVTSHESAMPT